jgi:hypothetical protein
MYRQWGEECFGQVSEGQRAVVEVRDGRYIDESTEGERTRPVLATHVSATGKATSTYIRRLCQQR